MRFRRKGSRRAPCPDSGKQLGGNKVGGKSSNKVIDTSPGRQSVTVTAKYT